MNKILTIMGAERKLFAVVLTLSGATYMQTHSWKLVLPLFVIGHFLAYLLTLYDERIIEVLRRVFQIKSNYDPIKHQKFSIRVKQ